MAQPDKTRPTLDTIRAGARACGIEVAAEREAFILAGAQHLYDAARRLDAIAAGEASLQEPVRP
ncbi:hypothetical protein D3C72_2106840 [compost metagenome]